MSIELYMDVHVPRAVTEGLRLREVDVLTAQEDDTAEIPDPQLLDRATVLGRVLVSQDKDLLREAAFRQRSRSTRHGVSVEFAEVKLTRRWMATKYVLE